MRTQSLKERYGFDFMGSFDENGITRVRRGSDWGFFNKDENLVTGMKYQYAYSFRKGFACVQEDGKWGLINLVGEEVLPCEYTLEEVRTKQAVLSQ